MMDVRRGKGAGVPVRRRLRRRRRASGSFPDSGEPSGERLWGRLVVTGCFFENSLGLFGGLWRGVLEPPGGFRGRSLGGASWKQF